MANDRNRSLDGLRALAVSLVLVSHGFGLQPRFLPWPDRFTPVWPGSMGVRIFFVLSGWLITGILLRARDEASAFGVSRRRVWLAFYMRRCCRIFPLAYFAILVAFIADVQNVREHLRWYLFYGSNVLAAYQGDNVGELGHLWSLAVEEQFYLVWPLVVLLVPMSRLPSLILTLIAGSVVLRGLIYAFWTPHGDLAAYVLTVSRFDALGIGGFLAVRPLSVRTLSISGIAIVACGAVLPSALSAALTEFGLGLACAALVLSVANGWASRVWSAWPLVALGTISYGVYVWHTLAGTIVLWIGQTFDVWMRWDNTFGWWRFTYVSAVAIGLASLSWFLIEKPINRLKRFAPYVPRPEPAIVSESGGGTRPAGVESRRSAAVRAASSSDS